MQHAAEEKLGDRLIADWVSGAHLQFADDEAREKYQARARLIVDTIRLEVTGRIPVIPAATQKFALDYDGVTFREAMTEFDKAFAAYVHQYEDTDFDAYAGPEFIFPAGMFEALAVEPRAPAGGPPARRQVVPVRRGRVHEGRRVRRVPGRPVGLGPAQVPAAALAQARAAGAAAAAAQHARVPPGPARPGAGRGREPRRGRRHGGAQGVRRGRAGVVRVPGPARPGAGRPPGPPAAPRRHRRRAVRHHQHLLPRLARRDRRHVHAAGEDEGPHGAPAAVAAAVRHRRSQGPRPPHRRRLSLQGRRRPHVRRAVRGVLLADAQEAHPRPGRGGTARVGLHAGQVRLAPAPLQGDPRGDVPDPPRERHRRLPGEGGARRVAVHRGQRLERAAGRGARGRGRGLLPAGSPRSAARAAAS